MRSVRAPGFISGGNASTSFGLAARGVFDPPLVETVDRPEWRPADPCGFGEVVAGGGEVHLGTLDEHSHSVHTPEQIAKSEMRLRFHESKNRCNARTYWADRESVKV